LKLTEGCQPHFPWLAASEKNLTPGNWKRAFCFVEFPGLPNISAQAVFSSRELQFWATVALLFLFGN